MIINEKNKITYEKILKGISNTQDTFMDIGGINTGFVCDNVINKLMYKFPKKSKGNKINVITISDYGEFVKPIKNKYGDFCDIYCVPTTIYGYRMCILALSVYVDNPEKFVIFDERKLKLFGFGFKYFKHIMKSKNMTFDFCVANPPYGKDGKGTNKKLHFDIMRVCLSLCDKVNFIMPSKCVYDATLSKEREMLRQNGCYKIEIQDKSIFPNTQMPPTAIYFCDKSLDQYDEKLGDDIYIANKFFKNDTEEYIYNIFKSACIDNNTMYKHAIRIDGEVKNDENNHKLFDNICEKLRDYTHFINISYANHGMSGEWIAQKELKGAGVKNIDEEIEFILKVKTSKFVVCFNSESAAKNLYNLLQSKLMGFCLWVLQDDRNMKQKVYQLFPELDYENIYDEKDLLREVKCDESKIEEILKYVESFDFTKKRNDRFLNQNN